jgi:8-oxo-dGTP pyrophosphatase MutT (NUDIX family)
MAGEVITLSAGQQPPDSWDACILVSAFGSDPGASAARWQAEVIALLRHRWAGDGRLVVFLDEPGGPRDLADVVMFWWPSDVDRRLVSESLAAWSDGHRAVHGTPAGTGLSDQLSRYASCHPDAVAGTLGDLVGVALGRIGAGAHRVAGERDVPLDVWRTSSFQRWYSAQAGAGNTLLSARPVWTFSAGPDQGMLMYWALHVSMYVRAEERVKSNEVVISRPDISVMALYQRGATIDDTVVVLVREYRSPASTPDGFVHELPGGSAAAEPSPLDQAIAETAEETGLTIGLHRIRAHSSRQLAATMSAHHAHLFSAEITGEELVQLRASQAKPHGAGDTERTWPEITTFGELRRQHLADWATLGMIAEAVLAD